MTFSIETAIQYYFQNRHDEQYGDDHRRFCRMYIRALRDQRVAS